MKPELLDSDEWSLLHDNAPAYRALILQDHLTCRGFVVKAVTSELKRFNDRLTNSSQRCIEIRRVNKKLLFLLIFYVV